MSTKTSPTQRGPKPTAPAGSRPAKRAAAEAAAAEPTVEEVVAIAEAIAEAVAPTPTAVGSKPRTVAITTGECTCRTCDRTRPVTKFPTKAANKDGSVDRDDQCRECRDAKRIANKQAATKAA